LLTFFDFKNRKKKNKDEILNICILCTFDPTIAFIDETIIMQRREIWEDDSRYCA